MITLLFILISMLNLLYLLAIINLFLRSSGVNFKREFMLSLRAEGIIACLL